MASNDQWPPVALASAGKGSTKINGNKRNIKESQQETLKRLNEMFDSTLEPAVILSVVQNCNWELQPSIEGLITLSETVENPLIWNDTGSKMKNIASAISDDSEKLPVNIASTKIIDKDCAPCTPVISPKIQVAQEPVSMAKTDKPKKGGTKNRMGSFCGNIAKLKSSGDHGIARDNEKSSCKIDEKRETLIPPEVVPFFDNLRLCDAMECSNFPSATTNIVSNDEIFDNPRSNVKTKSAKSPAKERRNKSSAKIRGNRTDKEKFENLDEIKDCTSKDQKVASFDSKMNIRKNEPESLCGLKVQYRLSGMEGSSDDDADVVIEEESSVYMINLTSALMTSVSQFLSPSTETPPQMRKPEIHMISTPSPPTTPQRSAHDATLARIKATIKRDDKIIILLRGLPGSGKTTLAKSILATTTDKDSSIHIFSADDFFTNLGRGVYKFDSTKLSEAHATCQKRVSRAMKEGQSPIIIDNTNIEVWEMRPYASMAVENGYLVEILEPNTPWSRNPKELAEKNTHKVSMAKISERAGKYERLTNGQRLLDKYGLKYSSRNVPPRSRLESPIVHVEKKQENIISCVTDIKSNWDNDQKNNYVLTSHDIESMQNIDETHNAQSTMIDECKIVNDKSSNSSVKNSSSNYPDKEFDDYLQELQDSDDESFEMLEESGSEHLSEIGKSLDIEASSGSQRSVEITKSTIDESGENFASKDSSPIGSSHQALGAIGSERKGSLAFVMSNNDSEKTKIENNGNVLSQCWDFTMILGSHKLHSRHGHYVSPFKISTDESTMKIDDNIVNTDKDISEENNEFKVDEKDITLESEIIIKEECKMDEITDDSCVINKGKLSPDVTKEEKLVAESFRNDDELNIEVNPVLEENIVSEDTTEINTYIPADFTISPVIYDPQDFSESSVKVVSMSDPEIAIEIKDNEVAETSGKTTFGSLLNLIKTSILGGSDETSTRINEEAQKMEDIDTFLSLVGEESQPCKDVESTDDEGQLSMMQDGVDLANQKEKDLTNENEGILINLDIIDSPMMEKIVEKIDEIVAPTAIVVTDEKILEAKAKILENISKNVFKEEMASSMSDEKNNDSTCLLTDNINSISWKESPFPIDGTKIPALLASEAKTIIPKVDAQTMTTFYDFNVAYVGGTSEPEYRELWGVSRSINEGTKSFEKMENRGSKIMFDKSSMTGESDILANEENFGIEKEKDSTNRLDDLIEMFPHYPSEYLKTLYEQQCNCNFDWVLDVLILADVPNLTIENYEKKDTSIVKNDESVVDAVKLWKIENEKMKQRSHSSSPRNRRNRAKGYRSFSLECVEDRCNFTSSEKSVINENDNIIVKNNDDDDKDNKILEMLYAKAVSDTINLPIVQNDLPEAAASSSSTASGLTNDIIDEDGDEIMELNFGREFINQLENTCGNPDFSLPDEFKPVIRIKKSMIDELYGLWIQSMDRQMSALHAQLDERMAKDEAMARAVDREETIKTREPVVPNLEEIMNMEMALASYQNELKEIVARETPNDMASRLTRQMLYELLPDMDKQTLSDILKAHDGNFKETCDIIEANIGRTISKTDTLKKQQSLLQRVNEERKNRDIQQNSESMKTPVIVVNPDICGIEKFEKCHYKDAIERGDNARMEAQKQFSLRIENYNKAAEAYRKGNPQVAAYYSQMVKLHAENIKAAHADAADEFLSARMYMRDADDTLDLHNLFVREALQALDVFLEFQLKKLNKSNKRSTILFIITGYGARSNNGLGRIKPAVSKKLISRNIRFTEANPGCLRVTLSRRNGMLD